MELRYIVLTIIKILISVPAVLLVAPLQANGSALMGGHLDNRSRSSTNLSNTSNYIDLTEDELRNSNDKSSDDFIPSLAYDTEEIPDPSALVVSGYNLPENIFNKGKPFYLGKDPLTGAVDFESITDLDQYDDKNERDVDNYDKSSIDRSDGSLSSHSKTDINQLTPNIHAFLPAKYPDKLVYPLISSPYANTKIQGNVNKHHNHKDYGTNYKPMKSPTYLSTNSYFNNEHRKPEDVSTTTVKSPTNGVNLMNSEMNHPSFNEDYSTQKQKPDKIYITSPSYPTTNAVTTERSILEQIFDDDEETEPTPNKDSYEDVYDESYNEPSQHTNGHAGPYQNVLTGSNMKDNSAYEYGYYDTPISDGGSGGENTTTEVSIKPPLTQFNVLEDDADEELNEVAKQTTTPFQVNQNDDNFKASNVQRNISAITGYVEKGSVNNDDVQVNKQTNLHTNKDYGNEYDDNYEDIKTTTNSATILKVTSLPLGENHVTHSIHQPIIVATHNLREQLINEKVAPKPLNYKTPPYQLTSTSNIHIAPDQDTVSFVVGNHQHVDGQYINTALKDNPYESNPFRHVYTKPLESFDTESLSDYIIKTDDYPPVPSYASSLNTQPIRNSEASLAIGLPIDLIKTKPGQVVDESLEINNEKIEFPKGNGPKIIFPDDKTYLVPPSVDQPPQDFNNHQILKLSSKPLYEQLPSDLTPPDEGSLPPLNRQRPPWDPRPGHFYSGRPEYVRPPRPVIVGAGEAYKRLDTLPNVLPQFRPNMKMTYFDHVNKGYMRQPLLDRPSNKPIGIFEKLQPPLPPKNFHIRKIPQLEKDLNENAATEVPITKVTPEQFIYYQTPPKVVLANRRNAHVGVETLQMIQAKQDQKNVHLDQVTASFQANLKGKETIEKPVYVVYPVNTQPLKLDALDANKKESVVIGTRAESPLPPSKIHEENKSNYEPSKINDFNFHDRHDSPILKPHPRPNFPMKSNFPYPMERPDPSLLNPTLLSAVPSGNNNLDNEWDLEDGESKIISEKSQTDQISVKLKTYTERPIAIAYTPTEPHYKAYYEKYSSPNFASPVIPEIRKGDKIQIVKAELKDNFEDKITHVDADLETTHVPPLDFQAPFQASVNVDNMSQGWSVVRDTEKINDDNETTTVSTATTSKFDMEKFKPEFIGGFQPIYTFPDDPKKEFEIKDRGE